VQISSNTTGMQAGLFVTADREARDHCVVVVKGTFQTSVTGQMTLAGEQRPLVATDEHHGAPETSCVRYECDFVLEKPLTDVVVVGKAVAPGGRPVSQLNVCLQVQGRSKEALVFGERRWVRVLGGMTATPAAPFTEMPLTFDRAFGGQDDSRGPEDVAVEHRNLAGVGFHPHRTSKDIDGTLLPNIEHPAQRISSPRDRPEPVGFGCLGRTWKDRVKHAGTYDQRWLEETYPYLPGDFDSRYFQSAPEDQRFAHFVGGEVLRCVHMAATAQVTFVIPKIDVPVRFGFIDRVQERAGILDTVTLEPHLGLATLVWRASVPLGKKLTALQDIAMGPRSEGRDGVVGRRDGKPVFDSLDAAIRWRRQLRGEPR
jgi:hypothetical protein